MDAQRGDDFKGECKERMLRFWLELTDIPVEINMKEKYKN